MGKSKRDYGPPHARSYKWLTNLPVWRSLSITARCLELELKLIYNGSNNGELFLSVRRAAELLNVSTNTAMKAFQELEEKGFIKAKQRSNFDWKKRIATCWILTEYPAGTNPLPSKDFMQWKPEENSRSQKLRPTVSKTKTVHSSVRPENAPTVAKNETVSMELTPF